MNVTDKVNLIDNGSVEDLISLVSTHNTKRDFDLFSEYLKYRILKHYMSVFRLELVFDVRYLIKRITQQDIVTGLSKYFPELFVKLDKKQLTYDRVVKFFEGDSQFKRILSLHHFKHLQTSELILNAIRSAGHMMDANQSALVISKIRKDLISPDIVRHVFDRLPKSSDKQKFVQNVLLKRGIPHCVLVDALGVAKNRYDVKNILVAPKLVLELDNPSISQISTALSREPMLITKLVQTKETVVASIRNLNPATHSQFTKFINSINDNLISQQWFHIELIKNSHVRKYLLKTGIVPFLSAAARTYCSLIRSDNAS